MTNNRKKTSRPSRQKSSSNSSSLASVLETSVALEEAKEVKAKPKVKAANEEQILGAKLSKEREIRIQYMKKLCELQKEVVALRHKLAEAHEQLINMQIDKLNKDSREVLTSIGLKVGQRITDQYEGRPNEWVIVEKE